MPMQAILRYGNPVFVPYTPGSAVAAGDVIVSGTHVFIAHQNIAANELGAVAVGGGVYEMIALTGDVITMGDLLYWDDANNNAEAGATGNTAIGPACESKGTGVTIVLVAHSFR